ncbi:MAG: DUF2142 domain-containing protein [Candidatus Moranbacteria bacterium]|nr:DUF2142 domain-containing protein [Candidatus Moranbacteria bacterium]
MTVLIKPKKFFHLIVSKPEYLFLTFALVWGFFQVVIMPPFRVPDEPNHFRRAWGLSEFQIVCNKDLEVNIPQNASDLEKHFDPANLEIGNYSFGILKELSGEKISTSKINAYTQFCSYNPIGYIPQAIGIDLAKISNLSPIAAFFFARFFNLFVAIFIIFFAIRIAPFGKMIFVLSALLPMSMHQFGSVSMDALAISGLFFFTALILYYSQKETLENKDLLVIGSISLLFIQVKPGYIFFLLLLFVLRLSQFRNWKRYFGFLLAVTFLNFVLFATLNGVSNHDKYLKPDFYPVNPNEQLNYVKNNPGTFGKILTSDISSKWWAYSKETMGRFSWGTLSLPDYFYIFIALFFICIVLYGEKKVPISIHQRVLIFFVAVMTIALVEFIEYVFWTEPENNILRGIQGRYFLPIVPLFALVFLTKKHVKKIQLYCSIAFFFILTFVSLATIYRYFYIQKKYLFKTPQYSSIYQNFSSIIEEENGIQNINPVKNKFQSLNSDPWFIICTANIKGISFATSVGNGTKLYYLFDGQSSYGEKYSDNISARDIILNIDELEKFYKKKLINLRIDPTNAVQEFEFTNIKIYK